MILIVENIKMCLYPRLITNRKYESNKKNKGIVPVIKDKRIRLVPIGCGKCRECKKQKRREWQVRLHEEIRNDKRGKFVTFSYSNKWLIKLQSEIKGLKGYELDNETATISVRKFLERWRKKHKKSVKHWLVTELGQKKTERIHIHGIIWTEEEEEEISKKWKYGNVWIGEYVSERTINYIIKYISKTDEKHKEYKSKILTSKGIGKGYLKRWDSKTNKYKGEETKELYTTRNGMKLGLPIYYRNAIYTEEEREKLWIYKIDKEIRYVNGIKIDISKNEDVYYKRLDEARIKNKFLGYGDNKINWKKRKYENERRNIKKMEIIQKLWKENYGIKKA